MFYVVKFSFILYVYAFCANVKMGQNQRKRILSCTVQAFFFFFAMSNCPLAQSLQVGTSVLQIQNYSKNISGIFFYAFTLLVECLPFFAVLPLTASSVVTFLLRNSMLLIWNIPPRSWLLPHLPVHIVALCSVIFFFFLACRLCC